ncbi:MAG: response regulator, partial [Planctomycetota bacterium]|nr:response regulator [Planctomycetota bacterium]
VEDNGPGMTEEVRQRCLDPFFTTRGASGTGLGLSGVHGIARRHRASLEIESELGQGALIRIRFKVSQGAEVRHVSESPAVGVKPLHILVVEDEINQRNLYQMLLVAQGHTVVTAADGREGLARFSEEPFDLVITDQSMPGMSGEQLGRAIKSTSDVPIILLTGFGFLMDDPPEGIDEVLSKPITQETLLTMVKKAIDS